ncbi:hypothetical protein C8F04DRAFT_1059960 [Mycena alexandri]|uniref:Uncharacterized protein n=1 Tax=Mycena alexandri TaxID=1745969 RepID=A0AAD6TP61_9AGAR|nr:hypothetical protein C8F04DRAFT_1059960 [Mycena alexandri]
MLPPNSAEPSQLLPVSPPPPFARYPLTVFDNSFQRSAFVTGWLVQGEIDTNALGNALRRMTEKWRVLAGRLEAIPDTKNWQICVPLGPLPEDYPTFLLTASISDVPLSTYITIPLETSSESLPLTLFFHPASPRQNSDWVVKNLPITCWHVTHFPSRVAGEPSYSCIGFGRSHGIFDGIGAASVIRALVAEMQGKEWDVPPPPPEGYHPNPIDQLLLHKVGKGPAKYPQPGYSALGVKGTLWLVGWHLRERYWRGSIHRIFSIPQECISLLVEGVKSDVQRNVLHSVGENILTTGDVLVAWLVKVIYAQGSPPQTVMHCSNFASFRDLIAKAGGESLAHYPHNAFLPLPYPTLTVKEVNSLTLPQLTWKLCQARHELNLDHVISAHQFMTSNTITMPVHPSADETLVISNVSASRILEADWSAVGSQGTICGYRFSATPTSLIIGNAAYISGRVGSSTILDVNLNKARTYNLTRAIEELKIRVLNAT